MKSIESLKVYDEGIKEMLSGFKDRGFNYVLEDGVSGRQVAGFYEESNILDLVVYVDIGFGNKEDSPSVWCGSNFYGENSIPKSEWKSIPRRFDREVTLIRKLDNYIASFDVCEGEALRNCETRPDSRMSYSELYSHAVREGNLRWTEINGESFPYVLIDSKELDSTGVSMGGLFFVAKDAVVKHWQEKIVSYHERFCGPFSHQFALEKEMELAKKMGIEGKVLGWRKELDARFK